MVGKGGMGTITQKLAQAAMQAGATIQTGQGVQSISIKDGVARGVQVQPLPGPHHHVCHTHRAQDPVRQSLTCYLPAVRSDHAVGSKGAPAWCVVALCDSSQLRQQTCAWDACKRLRRVWERQHMAVMSCSSQMDARWQRRQS